MRTDTPGMTSSILDEEDISDAAYRPGGASKPDDYDDIFASNAAQVAIREADDELYEARFGNRR